MPVKMATHAITPTAEGASQYATELASKFKDVSF